MRIRLQGSAIEIVKSECSKRQMTPDKLVSEVIELWLAGLIEERTATMSRPSVTPPILSQ